MAEIEPAGDGNINWVRRVRAPDGRSAVLKQARPALERFPEYRVSTDRLLFEARYLETAAPFDRSGLLPRVLHFDADARVLVLEDLGDAERLDHALARGADVAPALRGLAAFLGRVHAGTREAGLAARFANDEMQRLHGDHVFRLPFRENDFPLSPALRERAEAIRRDAGLVARIDAAHARYLEPRGALVHADVQSGNVLLAGRGPVLLDAEIAHVGDPAFDLGILLAHVRIDGVARGAAAAAEALASEVFDAYAAAHGEGAPSRPQADLYAGIELLRRTLGAARVPAVATDEAGLAVVEAGVGLVRGARAQATSSPSSSHSMRS
ncbi:MAG: phosphotransferase [Myxococcota bacterium]